ncbi:MAG: hypothetical protein IKL29_07115 [Bacteroidaceae bacterium]|nr:hypothetical protein [Bacteroidaceae bacterium]
MKQKIIYIFLLFVLSGTVYSSKAQENSKLNIFVQTNCIVSNGDYAPYWLTALRQGIVSVENNSGILRTGGSYKGTFDKKGDFGYNLTTDIAINNNHTSDIFVQQAFADLSWRWLTLSIGSKERFGENKTHTDVFNSSSFYGNRVNTLFPNLYALHTSQLGSGGLTYSGNSRPIPQVRLEIPHYIPFPGTNNWLHIRAHIAYGRFSDDSFQERHTQSNPIARYGKNILYHSKAAFIKIGKEERFPLTFEGGVELYSQFGGDIYTHGSGLVVSMPGKFKDYIKAFIPLSGGDDTPLDEQTNISGNQTGSWHAALTLHTKPVEVSLYGEHMFEDFSQLFFFEYQSNKEGKRKVIYYPWKDILLGIRITNKSSVVPFIKSLQYEYLNTYDQSGALYHDPSDNFNEQMDGVDNYYNHGIYPGWHHWGMGMGNPLVISPIYNRSGAMHFKSNRLKAHNVGINGTLENILPIAYRLQYTYSENWGTYINPLTKKAYSTSLLAEFIYAPDKSHWAASLSIGYDKSSFIGENIGAMLSIARTFTVKD